jgi:hypothetical protein
MLNPTKKVEIALIAATASLVLIILFLSAVPPVSRDALTHHLFVPKLYIQKQGMVEIPWLRFSYYPMNLDMLYIVPLLWGNDILPKYIHCSFALLSALLVFLYLRRWLNRVYAYTGILLFLAIPLIIKLCITVYVDLGLVFFSTAALFFVLRWVENDLRLKDLIYAALFCGLALGTKYNGLPVFGILMLLIPAVGLRWRDHSKAPDRLNHSPASDQRHHFKKVCLHWGLFGAVALMVFSPWMIRNAVWTGNPLHPLYQSTFKALHELVTPEGPASTTVQLKAKKTHAPKPNHFMVRRQIYNEDGLDILLIPLRIFFQGQDDNPQYFDGRLTPLLLALPLFAFVGFRTDDRLLRLGKCVWLAFAILYLLIAYLTVDMRVRYVAPIIPPLTILSIFGLRNIIMLVDRHVSGVNCKVLKFSLILAVIIVWAGQLGYIAKQYRIYRPEQYLSGKISRQEYIQKFRPEHAVLTYANQNIPERSRIFGIYLGGRGYYSDREIRFGNRLFEDIIRRSSIPQDMTAKLRKRGFTHILISMDLFNQWSAPRLTEDQVSRAQAFFQNEVEMLFRQGPNVLYRLNRET